MTLKANANQQSTIHFFRVERRTASSAVPRLRRVSRLPEHVRAEAILIPVGADVNLELERVSSELVDRVPAGSSTVSFLASGVVAPATLKTLGEPLLAASYDGDEEDEDEDEDEDFDDDDELDDEEDLEDEDDEDFDEELDDEDEDLDDEEDEEEDDEDDE